jgi:Lrp/AsnC family leucine-responsive transcriptional regulator
MDSLDYLIISELLKDGSLSFVEIAEKVHTTPYTVRRRYEKLKKEGVIQRCIASIDLSKLGYQGKAILLITVTSNSNKTETIAHLKTVKNIIVVTEIIGPFDILAIAPIVDFRSVRALVKETRKAPYVQRVELACIEDTSFPVSSNFGSVLSKKSQSLASAT